MDGGLDGWYPDPWGRFDMRYHNGTAWTADVAVDGRRYVDPGGAGGGPAMVAPLPAGRNGLAIASMTCGIVAVGVGWFPFVAFAAAVLGAIAFVLGLRARRRAATTGAGHGQAVAGITTGALGVAASAFGIWFTFALVDALDRYDHPAAHAAELVSCGDGEPGDRVRAAVAITNESRETATFSVSVVFDRGIGRGEQTEQETARDVRPGERREVAVLGPAVVDLDDLECRLDVNGPPPFGLDPSMFED